jgi:hypothetical protein
MTAASGRATRGASSTRTRPSRWVSGTWRAAHSLTATIYDQLVESVDRKAVATVPHREEAATTHVLR